jgi:Mrp family chromosome partitioning ATPase
MARILEVLRQGEQSETQWAAPAPGAAASPQPPLPPKEKASLPGAAAPAAAPAAEDGAMPYIEVGGKGEPISASPEVLAAAPAGRTTPLPARTAAPLPWSAAFQPCTATPRRLSDELFTFHHPDHPVSQQYRALLTTLLKEQTASGPLSWLFTAAESGVGTTTVVLNLAIAACAQGRQVALVDANWSRPALARRLGLPASPGLREVLLGLAAPAATMQTTPVPGLYALPTNAAGTLPPPARDALRWLLNWLRQRFDLVLLDGPIWQDTPDLLTLIALADCTYPVLRNDTPAAATEALLDSIRRQGGQLRGLLHTRPAA